MGDKPVSQLLYCRPDPEGWRPRCPAHIRVGHLFQKRGQEVIVQVTALLDHHARLEPVYAPEGQKVEPRIKGLIELLEYNIEFLIEPPEHLLDYQQLIYE